MASRVLRFLAIGATLALAACGGNAAPASSPSTAAPASAAAKPSSAASAKPAASAAAPAKPAASGSAAAKPAASGAAAAAGGAAAKPALPSGCPAPSPAASAAAKPAAGASGGASPAAKPSAAAKPSFTPQTDVIGEAAPGPYKATAPVTETAGTPVKLQAIGVAFEANTIMVKAGDNVTLNITNCATFQHNFVSPALGVATKVDIPVGGDATVTFKAPDKPGKYMFWCSVKPATGPSHAERGMTGEVIVQ